MHRPPLLALLVSIASFGCSQSPAPTRIPTNHASPKTYELLPLAVSGGEGRHSASHSSTTITGSLALEGANATLSLKLSTFTGHVRCNWNGQSRQACASPGTKDTTTTDAWILRGELRPDRGALTGTLRDDKHSIALTCAPSFIGLACSITGQPFGFHRPQPTTLAFAVPSPKRFELVPIDVAGVGRVAGAIEMTNARSIVVSLSVDHDPPTRLPGTIVHQDADGGGHGLLVTAQTSPTRTFSARCKIVNDNLACDLSVDRSVLGKPDHVSSTTVWQAKRT
jgi:hypothetical protein